MDLLSLFYREMEANRGRIRPVLTGTEIEKNMEEGKMSALLTIEEGAVCRGEIENLRRFYEKGVRMMTLTWKMCIRDRVQCVLKEGMEPEQIVQLETLKVEKRGRLSTITARGKREEIETVMASVHPVFYEIIPLSLEEIFISETEVVGYDIKKLVL